MSKIRHPLSTLINITYLQTTISFNKEWGWKLGSHLGQAPVDLAPFPELSDQFHTNIGKDDRNKHNDNIGMA